jgi:mRNA-degrading endonuclease RelE of RelBE toxin-antitoxin system
VPVTVEITPQAQAQVDRLNEPMYGRVLAVVERLHSWPAVSGAKPLRGRLAGHYRIRAGDYRVQFHVQGNVVVIEKVGHRDGFYED